MLFRENGVLPRWTGDVIGVVAAALAGLSRLGTPGFAMAGYLHHVHHIPDVAFPLFRPPLPMSPFKGRLAKLDIPI
jgi:hypothetical protein